MKAASVEGQAIQQHCMLLRQSTMGGQSQTLAEQAARGAHARRLPGSAAERRRGGSGATDHRTALEGGAASAHQTLEEFGFAESKRSRPLRSRSWPKASTSIRSEPVLLMGDCGTGKTHLMTGLCVAACRIPRCDGAVQRTGRGPQQLQLSRTLSRWSRYQLIAIDEVGYVPMSGLGAAFLFQASPNGPRGRQ